MITKIANLVLFGLMILMNYLANALPINNKTTGQLSDQLPNLFTPAGLTFSIWGIIYLLLGVFCVLQFRSQNKAMVEVIGWWFALTCLLNAMWILAWHFEILPLSLIIMIGLLVSLVVINLGIRPFSAGWTKAAFGIYLGWICIATIANVTALLVSYGWKGAPFSETSWTIILILIGATIVTLTISRLSNPFIGLAVIWAFSGIMIKRVQDSQSILITAAFAAVFVLIVTVVEFFKTNSVPQS